MKKNAKNTTKVMSTGALRDLIIIALAVAAVFVLAHFFNLFEYLMRLFRDDPGALTWIDEIITGLVTLSVGFAVFSWRRWGELRKETAERIRLQEELLRIAETRVETERIISKQLHSEIDERKRS